MQQKICSKGEYYIMNRQELLGFFLQKKRINTILCGRCQKDDCCNCNRFNYIREQLGKKMPFSKNKTGCANQFYGKFLMISSKNQII